MIITFGSAAWTPVTRRPCLRLRDSVAQRCRASVRSIKQRRPTVGMLLVPHVIVVDEPDIAVSCDRILAARAAPWTKKSNYSPQWGSRPRALRKSTDTTDLNSEV